jgi:hypothetical protein
VTLRQHKVFTPETQKNEGGRPANFPELLHRSQDCERVDMRGSYGRWHAGDDRRGENDQRGRASRDRIARRDVDEQTAQHGCRQRSCRQTQQESRRRQSKAGAHDDSHDVAVGAASTRQSIPARSCRVRCSPPVAEASRVRERISVNFGRTTGKRKAQVNWRATAPFSRLLLIRLFQQTPTCCDQVSAKSRAPRIR